MSEIFLWWVSLKVLFYISVINTITKQTKNANESKGTVYLKGAVLIRPGHSIL